MVIPVLVAKIVFVFFGFLGFVLLAVAGIRASSEVLQSMRLVLDSSFLELLWSFKISNVVFAEHFPQDLGISFRETSGLAT